MIKNSIAYYTEDSITGDRTNLSLMFLKLNKSYYAEDLFYAVEDSENFDQLTNYLKHIIRADISEISRTDRKIVYQIEDAYLCIKVKGDK